MKPKTLLAYCLGYLHMSDGEFAIIVSENSSRPFNENKIAQMRQGHTPTPSHVWTALKRCYSEQCPEAEKVIRYVTQTGKNILFVTRADMENPHMGDTLIKSILQLPKHMRAAFDPIAPPDVITWGNI